MLSVSSNPPEGSSTPSPPSVLLGSVFVLFLSIPLLVATFWRVLSPCHRETWNLASFPNMETKAFRFTSKTFGKIVAL